MSRTKPKGDVAWFIPNRKTPIAYSTKSTKDLLDTLFEQFNDLEEVYRNIRYDEDAKRIVKLYLDKGIKKVFK